MAGGGGGGGGAGSGDVERRLYEALVHGTRASNSFPGEEDDLGYFESIPEFRERVAGFRDRIVKLILDLASNVDSSDDLFNLAYLRDADPAEAAAFEPIANIIELLLENVDGFLDEAKQNNRSRQAGATSFRNALTGGSAGAASGATSSAENQQVAVAQSQLVREVRAGLHGVITHANNIERPQLRFKAPPDNSRSPFRPSISHKPNAIVPLPPGGPRLVAGDAPGSGGDLSSELEAHVRSLGSDVDRHQLSRFEHPYEAEIRAALESPPSWLFEASEPAKPKPLNEVPCTWVDSEDLLRKMCAELAGERAIAVDLENHSYRSFQGFCCLMQVSSSTADYLVDALALREHMHLLNEHFTNPNMVKVLHGSDSDVVWLQRDFGVYLVNLFDTGQSARVLQYPSAGLAHALLRHCQVRANKAYQLADWRIRPLTDDMFRYAREDTHYLLYIFERMRNELLAFDGEAAVRNVLKRGASIALTVYEKDVFTPRSYERLIKSRNLALAPNQEQVLAAVYGWRDAVARREDESTQYVLPDRMLVRVALEVPTSAADLEHCCNPLPPVVQTRVTEVLALIRSARDSSLVDEDQDEDMEVRTLTTNPPAASVPIAPGSAQIGLNAQRSTFVPINPIGLPPSGKKPHVSFADAAKGGLRASSDRRGSLMRSEVSSRATPSPVLTTEQLYDTAGWQDIADPSWKAAVVARAFASPAESNAVLVGQQGGLGRPGSDSFRTALATKAAIGEEQLQSSGAFGALAPKTPFAAMATAMSGTAPSLSMDGSGGSEQAGVASIAGQRGAVGSGAEDAMGGPRGGGAAPAVVVEDAVIDIDTPADADALESEDIPRSMAEIYRISNRNRKRNKDKKKMKDDGPGKKSSSGAGSGDDSGNRKRSKDEEESADGNPEGGADDAIEFMRDIGWVEGASKPVATLLVEGAPDEPTHLAGAGSDSAGAGASERGSERGGGGSSKSSKTGSSSSSSNASQTKSRGGRGKVPNSPKRKPANAGGGGRQGGSQQQTGQSGASQSRLYGYAAAANAPAGALPKKSGAGGFSYSQAAASAAGVRPGGASQGGQSGPSGGQHGNQRGGQRGGGGGNSNNQVFRKNPANFSSMSYSG